MPPVFGHGRLRLYLLKLLGEAPRHGYEVIRLLEERFQGLYAPSAGTVYPRLAKLEAEGLVTHTEEGGRKVYSLTPEGRRELGARDGELTALEREIRDSLTALAADIREDVIGSAGELRRQVRQAAARAGSAAASSAGGGRARRESRGSRSAQGAAGGTASGGTHRDTAQDASGDSAGKGTGTGACGEGGPLDEAQQQFEQAARRIQEQVQALSSAGDWPGAMREGLDSLGREIGGWSRIMGRHASWGEKWFPIPEQSDGEQDTTPEEEVTDPLRELERLLDRLRDDVRDAARDHGIGQDQLRESRRLLSSASAHLVALLRHGK